MSTIFTIIGLTILGFIVRAIFKDKDVAEKPKNNSDWIPQIIISLLVGIFVWACIPKSCDKYKNEDYDPADHQIIRR